MKILKVLPALIGTATVAATVLAVSSPAHALATWGINNLEFADGVVGSSQFDVVNAGSTFQYDSAADTAGTLVTSGVNVVVNTSTNAQSQLYVNSTYAFNEYTVVQSNSNILKLEFESTLNSSSTDNLLVSFTPGSTLNNTTLSSTPSGTQVTASISTNTALTNLTLEGGGGNNSAYAVQAISPIAFTSGQGSTGSTGVPFEVPGGATIPVFGSVLALGVMRKFGKNVKLGASVVDSGN